MNNKRTQLLYAAGAWDACVCSNRPCRVLVTCGAQRCGRSAVALCCCTYAPLVLTDVCVSLPLRIVVQTPYAS